MNHWLVRFLMSCLLGAATQAMAVASDAPQRIVALGASVTEIVYELGKGSVLVGNDLSSIYPPQATRLPRVGYYRNLPLEGLLSLEPDLILASEQAGPPDVLSRVQALGIPVTIISDNGSLESLYARIREISIALQVPEQGLQMEKQVRMQVEEAIGNAQRECHSDDPVRAIVLMKRTSHMQAAGSGTTAAALLQLAGLSNIVSAQQGYKPVSAEGLAALQPDLIITTSSSIEALGGKQAFSQSAGINLTPAAQRDNILIMDDMLILGLGPRTPQAIESLTLARDKARNTP